MQRSVEEVAEAAKAQIETAPTLIALPAVRVVILVYIAAPTRRSVRGEHEGTYP